MRSAHATFRSTQVKLVEPTCLSNINYNLEFAAWLSVLLGVRYTPWSRPQRASERPLPYSVHSMTLSCVPSPSRIASFSLSLSLSLGHPQSINNRRSEAWDGLFSSAEQPSRVSAPCVGKPSCTSLFLCAQLDSMADITSFHHFTVVPLSVWSPLVAGWCTAPLSWTIKTAIW